MPHLFDVELTHLERLAGLESLECHLVLYPYSRRISSEDLVFSPFEEYVEDIVTRHRSVYAPVNRHADILFGLGLGLLIALIFAVCKPADLFSVQSVVAVIGAYAVGKELWDDVEKMIISLTRDWRVRYQEAYYRYQLERGTTLTRFAALARKQRYGRASALPELMDFIQQCNSQTARLWFRAEDLRVAEEAAHILSIHVEPELLDDFLGCGYLFGVKLAFNRRRWFWTRGLEVFQSLHRTGRGCLDDQGRWVEGAAFYRHMTSLGRIRFFRRSGLWPGQCVIDDGRD